MEDMRCGAAVCWFTVGSGDDGSVIISAGDPGCTGNDEMKGDSSILMTSADSWDEEEDDDKGSAS